MLSRLMRMRTAPRALGAGALLALGLNAGTAAAAAPGLTLSACELEHPLRLTVVAAECGVLSVAENPRDPEGRHIGLHVARVPAISRRKQADPLFVLAGGPGAAAGAFYTTVAQVAFLWFDAIVAFDFGGRFGVGLGSLLMLTNVLLLSGYTFGCHAFRHLAGGELDCFSCSLAARARHSLWRGVTVLNVRHDRWAWASLVSVAGTDIYIRLLLAGVMHDPRWVV